MSLNLPRLAGNIFFNAQHAPAGAFMSFTCGHLATGGGIGLEIGKPATQNVFVGIRKGDRKSKAPIRCLPFMRGLPTVSAAVNFEADQPNHPAITTPAVESYPVEQVTRRYGWGSDVFETPEFTFSIYTPFGPIPEPTVENEALRAALLPAVVATIKVDNREGRETRTAVFALDFAEAGTRLLESSAINAPSRVGFAWRRNMGVLGMVEQKPTAPPWEPDRDGLFAFQRWSIAEGCSDVNPVHGLGSCGGIAMEVPAGQVRTLVLAIGVYLEGVVTTGLEGRYFYTRLYSGLDDVLMTALDRATDLQARAQRLDQKLLGSGLSADQQFLIAHGTRGYYGSTQLLDIGGEPFWVVNEGEYCMMNTLDLSIDHAFWELDHNPWVVRNVLTNFARHYSYHDQVKGHGGQQLPGGISFCHDMGAHNNFTKPGNSSYELANLMGCFSYMTQEQLCNWILLAGCYVAKTGDTQWLLENGHLIAACAESMLKRASSRTGLMTRDSGRCEDGQEITTYDSLDESLGQARANTYLGVKCWAAWLGIEMLLALRAAAGGTSDETVEALTCELADHLASCAGPDGAMPAVLERDSRGYESRILPAIEGLIYPAYWLACLRSRRMSASDGKADELLSSAMRHPLIEALRKHTVALLHDPKKRNVFADGGIKLSSTSNNSWMSKIAIFQYVARELLHLHEQDGAIAGIFKQADAAHVHWQTQAASAYWACSDQFVKGVAKASRYYPRVITAALWMDETTRTARAVDDAVESPRSQSV